jgi:hypothetical protein
MTSADDILERSQRLHQELLAQRVARAKLQHEAAMAELQQAIADDHPNAWQKILEARCVEAMLSRNISPPCARTARRPLYRWYSIR